jgi:hypothetical protein
VIADYTVILGQAEAPAPPASTAANPGIFPTPPPMAGLGAGAVAGGITFTGLFIALVIAFIAVKIYKSKVKDIVLGVCIGVLGAGGFVGAIAWTLIGIAVQLIKSLSSAVG